jgi:hypothetical protein
MIFINMKKALVLSPDWQDIEKVLREDYNYIVRCKDTKEGALEWCSSEKIDLVVGSYHKGIYWLSSSIAEQSGNGDFLTQNPQILLTWHPHFSEDRLEGFDIEDELDENGDSIVKPNHEIASGSIQVFRKPENVVKDFKTEFSSSLSSFLVRD